MRCPALIFALFLLSGSGLYAQKDFVVVNKDTTYCKLLECKKDTVTYISEGTVFKVADNYFTHDNIDFFPNIKITAVRFYQDPQSTSTFSEFTTKLDFSYPGPHTRKKLSEFANDGEFFIDTTNNRLYWFGLDFSNVVVMLGTAPRTQYSGLFFQDCNDFILSEKGMKDFRDKFSFIVDTGTVTRRNASINLSTIYNVKPKTTTIDSIRKALNFYTSANEGIGLLVLVTEIDKVKETETYFVIFFDIKTRSIILCLKETSKVNGIGMAQHWTNSITDYLALLLKKSNWKNKYFGKQR